MKIRPLILDDEARARAAEVKMFAAAHVFTIENRDWSAAPVGEDPRHTLSLKIGYRVVYSQEEQLCNAKPKLCHHISVSVDEEGMYPHELAVKEICELFGFKFPGICLWLEKEWQAVNVVAPVE